MLSVVALNVGISRSDSTIYSASCRKVSSSSLSDINGLNDKAILARVNSCCSFLCITGSPVYGKYFFFMMLEWAFIIQNVSNFYNCEILSWISSAFKCYNKLWGLHIIKYNGTVILKITVKNVVRISNTVQVFS